MRLAIQESILPGNDVTERAQYAAALGLHGLELDAGIPQLTVAVAALEQAGLAASAVNAGDIDLIHPDFDAREVALVHIRQAMATALDLGADGATFRPHRRDTPRLPDLHPYKSRIELEGELLVKQLKTTLSDLAYAMGTNLYLAPANHYETHLVQTLDQAASILRKNNDHPHVRIAANTCDLALEETEMITALRQHAPQIGYIRLVDNNGRLPGNGLIDFAAVITALREGGYDGWLTIGGSGGELATTVADLKGLLES
jgi:sugar phosphate isomerase/epimerase